MFITRFSGISPFIQRSIGQVAKQKLPSYAIRALSSFIPSSLRQHRYSLTYPLSPTNAVAKRTLSISTSPDHGMLLSLIQKEDWSHLERYVEGGVSEPLSYTLLMAMPLDKLRYSDQEAQTKSFFSLLKNIKDPSLKKEVAQRFIQSVKPTLLFKSLVLLEIEKIEDVKWKEDCSLQLAHRLLNDTFSDRDPEHNLPKLNTFLQIFSLLGQIRDEKKVSSDLKTLTRQIYSGLIQPSPSSLRQISFCIGCLENISVRREITAALLQNKNHTRYEITSFLNFLHPFEDEDFLPKLMQIASEQNLEHQDLFYTDFFSHVQNPHLCEEVAEKYLKTHPEHIVSLVKGLSCNPHLDSANSILLNKLSLYPLPLNGVDTIIKFWLQMDPSGKKIEPLLSQKESLRKDLLLYAIEHMPVTQDKLKQILFMLKVQNVQHDPMIQEALSQQMLRVQKAEEDLKIQQARPRLLTTPIGTFSCQRHSSTILTVDNFLSEEECTHLSKKYETEMAKSPAQSTLNSFKADRADLLQYCERSNFKKNPDRDPVIDKLLKNLAALLPSLNSSLMIDPFSGEINLDEDLEQLTIIRYKKNEGQFDPHYDNETKNTDHYNMRNRIATALIYLNTVEKGGATEFVPEGISIQPKRGTLLFFYNYDPASKNPNKPLQNQLPGTAPKYIPWYPSPINRHAGRTPESEDKTIISAFFMEHLKSPLKSAGYRNSRNHLPHPIMPENPLET